MSDTDGRDFEEIIAEIMGESAFPPPLIQTREEETAADLKEMLKQAKASLEASKLRARETQVLMVRTRAVLAEAKALIDRLQDKAAALEVAAMEQKLEEIESDIDDVIGG